MSGLEDRILTLIKELEEEKRLADKRAKQLFKPDCAFLAYNSANDANVTGDNTLYALEFDTEVFDQGGNYEPSTFTAPVDGRYPLIVNVLLYNLDADTYETVKIYLVTSNRTYINIISGKIWGSGGMQTVQLSVIADMDANDTVFSRIIVTGGAKSVGVLGAVIYTWFSGALLIKEN